MSQTTVVKKRIKPKREVVMLIQKYYNIRSQRRYFGHAFRT